MWNSYHKKFTVNVEGVAASAGIPCTSASPLNIELAMFKTCSLASIAAKPC